MLSRHQQVCKVVTYSAYTERKPKFTSYRVSGVGGPCLQATSAAPSVSQEEEAPLEPTRDGKPLG